jgi:hypothetical protein
MVGLLLLQLFITISPALDVRQGDGIPLEWPFKLII